MATNDPNYVWVGHGLIGTGGGNIASGQRGYFDTSRKKKIEEDHPGCLMTVAAWDKLDAEGRKKVLEEQRLGLRRPGVDRPGRIERKG